MCKNRTSQVILGLGKHLDTQMIAKYGKKGDLQERNDMEKVEKQRRSQSDEYDWYYYDQTVCTSLPC